MDETRDIESRAKQRSVGLSGTVWFSSRTELESSCTKIWDIAWAKEIFSDNSDSTELYKMHHMLY